MAGWLRPIPLALAAGAVADTTRSRSALLLENALLHHQLLILGRTSKRPRLTAADRGLLVLLASRMRTWADTLVIVQPATVLRWHRQGFRLFWRRTSRAKTSAPRISIETRELIRRMARENRLWSAERIRGELRKIDIRVSKRTIQKYRRASRGRRSCATTPRRSERAVSSRSPISGSARCTPSSSSRSARGASCMSA